MDDVQVSIIAICAFLIGAFGSCAVSATFHAQPCFSNNTCAVGMTPVRIDSNCYCGKSVAVREQVTP